MGSRVYGSILCRSGTGPENVFKRQDVPPLLETFAPYQAMISRLDTPCNFNRPWTLCCVAHIPRSFPQNFPSNFLCPVFRPIVKMQKQKARQRKMHSIKVLLLCTILQCWMSELLLLFLLIFMSLHGTSNKCVYYSIRTLATTIPYTCTFMQHCGSSKRSVASLHISL